MRPVPIILSELNEDPSRVPIGRAATDAPGIVPGDIKLDVDGTINRIEILRRNIGYL